MTMAELRAVRGASAHRERVQRVLHDFERGVSVIEESGRASCGETPFRVDDNQTLTTQLRLETRKIVSRVDESVDHVPVEVQTLKLARGGFWSAVYTHTHEARLGLWKRSTPGLHLLCDRATSASPGVVKVDHGRCAVHEGRGGHALWRSSIGGEHLDEELGHGFAGQAHGCCGGFGRWD